MPISEHQLSDSALLDILTLSKDATGIYTGQEITIRFVNDAMLAAWGKDRSVIGRTIEEALPELEGAPFFDLLKEVWRTGKTFTGRDIEAALNINGSLQTFYFDFEYRAIPDAQGNTYCILHTSADVTERHNAQVQVKEKEQREQQLNEELKAANEELLVTNEELAATNEELKSINDELFASSENLDHLNAQLLLSEQRANYIIRDAPVSIALLSGDDLTIEIANDRILRDWGRSKEVIGKPLVVALPELEGQPFIPLLQNVMQTGVPYFGNEVHSRLHREGRLADTYYNFVYHPIKDGDSQVVSVMIVSSEVTEQVQARQRVENSEHRLSSMIGTTPIGMAVLRGRELIIETGNQPVLEIWGRSLEEVQGRGLVEVFPELLGQPFPGLLQSVLDTGNPVSFPELPVAINQPDGSMKNIFVNFSYDPLFGLDGKPEEILVSVTDITSSVTDRQKIQEQQNELKSLNEELAATNEEIRASNEELEMAKEDLLASNEKFREGEASLRLTVGAANLGTWRMNAATREIILSPIGLKLYGLQDRPSVTAEEIIGCFVEQYQPLAVQQLKNALERNQPVDIQYEIIRPDNEEHRWLRSVGTTYVNPNTAEKWFYGVIMDITDQKQDEQRKNDFIGMVSHELKTPLTSLTGYLQMLQIKVKNSEDNFVVNALEKSVNQVKRMSALINGFLNVTRLEAGKIYLDKKPFDLSELLQHLIVETEYLQNSHIIHYTPCAEVQVIADRDKIGSVISNLLSNAIKYSPDRGDIQVNCDIDTDTVKISVADQGIGVKPEDQSRLFDRFYRVSSKKTQTIAGFGIGLYLCAEIIKEHHGTIGVDSVDGQGSTFWFALPLN